MAEKPIIEVQGLTKRFKGLTAVHDVSFSVGERLHHRHDRPQRCW